MVLKDRFATNSIRFLKIHKPSKAQGKLHKIYNQINKDAILVAPFTLHASEPNLVAAVWSANRETMFYGIVPRSYKEAIASEVARINECPFCVSVHTLVMQASGEEKASDTILHQTKNNIANEQLRDIIAWSTSTRTPDAEILKNPPFTVEEAPEIIGSALTFHYLTRMVNIFIEGDLMPNMGIVNGIIRKGISQFMLKSLVERELIPGDSLQFLPDALLPKEFNWAKDHPHISQTFAGINAIMNQHIEQTVSSTIIDLVQSHYDKWQGEDTGISRKWIKDATEGLSESEAIATSLMLLAGFAPYQISESDIETFRQYYPDDKQLLAVTAWGAWATVRRISTWLHLPNHEVRQVKNSIV